MVLLWERGQGDYEWDFLGEITTKSKICSVLCVFLYIVGFDNLSNQ